MGETQKKREKSPENDLCPEVKIWMIYSASQFCGPEKPHGFLQGFCYCMSFAKEIVCEGKQHVQDWLTSVFEHRYAFDLKQTKKRFMHVYDNCH